MFTDATRGASDFRGQPTLAAQDG